MRWDQTEFVLKGIYLGLLLTVALHGPTWLQVGIVAAGIVVGLALALAWAAFQRMRSGMSARGHFFAFLLYLLLENPVAVFTGIVGGLAAATIFVLSQHDEQTTLVAGSLVGGVVLGLLLLFLRSLPNPKTRNYLGLGLVLLLIGGAAFAIWSEMFRPDELLRGGVLLLLGIPGFYLLTFVSLVEESEMEMAALCATLGVGLYAVVSALSPRIAAITLLVPLGLYFFYVRAVLPGLRVFKHSLRGLSYNQIGQYDRALASLGRALQLNPRYPLAREQLWDLHRKLDLDKLKEQPTILAHVNYGLCLERVNALLLADRPQEPQIKEVVHLLDLVEHQRTDLAPICWYWRAVAACHRRNYDEAANHLGTLLAGEVPADPKARRKVLFRGWQLALVLHPEMRRRVGEQLIQHSARRFEAIAAVERELAALREANADDAAAWDVKRVVYGPLTEPMYLEQVTEGKVADEFDYRYVQEMGLALLDQADNWQRGCELLRVAARGLPLQAATLYSRIAKAHEAFNDTAGMWAAYSRAMQLGRAAGVANLSPEDRQHLFAAVKAVGERAIAENQIDTALDAFKFYSQKEEAGIETWRILAELFERKADAWSALHCTEHALTYNAADPDLLGRKDRYYYSITPDELKARWEQVSRWIDLEYVRTKTKWLLERATGNVELIDWASHLSELLAVAQPTALPSVLLRARVRRLRGEIPESIELLEHIRQNKPAKFETDEDQDAWFVTHRLLGDFYLDERPADAIPCYLEFRRSPRAGADTMYKLGRAYEAVGDFPRASRCYEEVTTFPEHPLYYEARDGLDRVKRGAVRGT
jgi:tetratricopeptide (TPR) repeat protein